MSYKRQDLVARGGRLCSLPVFDGVRVAHRFSFLCCVFFLLIVFELCLVYPMLPISLECPFLIAPSVSLTFIHTNQFMPVCNKDH